MVTLTICYSDGSIEEVLVHRNLVQVHISLYTTYYLNLSSITVEY